MAWCRFPVGDRARYCRSTPLVRSLSQTPVLRAFGLTMLVGINRLDARVAILLHRPQPRLNFAAHEQRLADADVVDLLRYYKPRPSDQLEE